MAPKELNHYNRVRSATITANLAPGVSLGEALDDLDAIAARTLPAGVRTDLAGQSREFREQQRQPDLRVRPGGGLHLPGAGGPVRELRPSR